MSPYLLFVMTGIISSLLKVTECINEVERVTESYINLFDQLLEESRLAEVSICKLSHNNYSHNYHAALEIIIMLISKSLLCLFFYRSLVLVYE